MVWRILRPTVGLGLVERPLKLSPVPVEQHAAQAGGIAEQGMVLLKNDGKLLPLTSADIRSIAVIGSNADDVSAAGGGSARVQSMRGVSVLEGIRQRAGAGVRVEFAPGADPIGPGALLPGLPSIPSCVVMPKGEAADARGWHAEYWANPTFEGAPQVAQTEPQVEMNRGFFDLPGLEPISPKRAPVAADLGIHLSARWTGRLIAPASGDYTLSLTCLGSGWLYLDDQRIIQAPWRPLRQSADAEPLTAEQIWTGGLASVHTIRLHLVAGQTYAVRVEYAADVPDQNFIYGAQVRLGWQPPHGAVWPDIAAAAELARRSDVAIVVARTFESESMDRPNLRLPNDQDRLIRAVTAANPRTIVVLMTGGPVEVANWESMTAAVLEAWFAGQEQGNAVARVLFGDVNPGGKLPLTFPRNADHTPLSTPAQYPGVDGAVHYSERLRVGYRGYDALVIEAEYAFGHGLSYTSFTYGQLVIAPEVTDGAQHVKISFELTNTGNRAGIEAAQVYFGFPAAAGEPPKRLADWARVSLQPVESRQLSVTVDAQCLERPLSFWSAETKKWEIAQGSFAVYMGASSRDIRLSGRFQVQ